MRVRLRRVSCAAGGPAVLLAGNELLKIAAALVLVRWAFRNLCIAYVVHYVPHILLDLMLPKIDGLEVCRILRREMVTPIIMLTARDDEIDRVVGFEVGADDYLTKSFSMRELMARIKAQLRRSRLLRFPKFANLLYLLWIAG